MQGSDVIFDLGDQGLLQLVERPPACPLARSLWREEQEPGRREFSGYVDEGWLARWSLPGGNQPWGWIFDAGSFVLYLSDLPVGVKIFKRLDQHSLRLLPYTLAIRGSNAGFSIRYGGAWLTQRKGSNRAHKVALDVSSLAPSLHSQAPYRLPSADIEATREMNEAIRREVRTLGGLLEHTQLGYAPMGWEAIFCRDVVVDRKSAAAMEGTISRLSALLYSMTGKRTSVYLCYARPGQLGQPSFVELALDPGQDWISDDLARRVHRGFKATLSRIWPDGWMRLIGPERTSLPLVETQLGRFRCLSGSRLGNHALLRAQADLL